MCYAIMNPIKNIVIITIDSLRYDHTSLANYVRDTTPFLKHLAQRGLELKNHYSNAPYTMASIHSIVFSIYPLVPGFEYYKMKHILTMPNLINTLRSNGYFTILVHSNPWFKLYGFDRLFNISIDPFDKLKLGKTSTNNSMIIKNVFSKFSYICNIIYNILVKEKKKLTLLKLNSFLQYFKSTLYHYDYKPYATSQTINYFLEKIMHYIDKSISSRRKQGILIWLHYMDVHEPYIPEKMYYARSLSPSEILYLMSLRIKLPERVHKQERQKIIDLYDSCIRQVDENIREAIAMLERYLDFDNTLILITSDHGEALGERGIYGHGGQGRKILLYEELVRIPLVMCAPSYWSWREELKCISECKNSSHVDIAPTIMSLIKLKKPKTFLGNNLFECSSYNEVVIQALELWDPHDFSDASKGIKKQAYIHGKYKLIIGSKGSVELYDLEKDPNEAINLALTKPELVRYLYSKLERKVAGINRRFLKLKIKHLLKRRLW